MVDSLCEKANNHKKGGKILKNVALTGRFLNGKKEGDSGGYS